MEDNVVTSETVTYTALIGDTVVEIIEGLVADVTDNHPTLYAKGYTNFTTLEENYLTVTPIEGYSRTLTSQSNTSSDTNEVYAETNTPCVFLAYGKQPTGNYPRITLTPQPLNLNQSPTFKTGSVEVVTDSGNFFPFVDKQVYYNINVTCESGAYEDVLEGKVDSAEDILNTLIMRLGVERNVKALMETMNSGYLESNTVQPSPSVAATEYMSIAGTSMNFNTIHRIVDMDGGVYTEVTYDAVYKIEDTVVATSSASIVRP
jgi:hypothetical protein